MATRRLGGRGRLVALAVAVTAAVVVAFAALSTRSTTPPDPPRAGADEPASAATDVPAGWQRVEAHGVALAVPPGWGVDDRAGSGPCARDVYVPPRPRLLIIEFPSTGTCRAVGYHGGAREPNLVVFASSDPLVRSEHHPWMGPSTAPEPVELGAVPAVGRRSEDTGEDLAAYVVDERTVLWVGQVDDPDVVTILSTLRPAG